MTDACNSVRLDQPQSSPDKQDALCLLSISDLSSGKFLTKADLETKRLASGTTQRQAAAIDRITANFDKVGHVVGSHSVEDPPSILLVGKMLMPMVHSHQETDFGVSREDLQKLTKKP